MDLTNLFSKLSDYCDTDLKWEEIDEIYEDAIANNFLNSENTLLHIESLRMVQNALRDENVLTILLEICASVHQLRSSPDSYDNACDSWDQVIKEIPRDKYLSFIYALAGIGALNPLSKTHRKLSIAAASTYILSLTIPGAKGYHIFDDKIIQQALLIFDLIEKVRSDEIATKLSSRDRDEIWVNFSSFYENLELIFRFVHFDKYKTARNMILQKLIHVQYLNHDKGYENFYAANLHMKSFDILNEVIGPHNGDPSQTTLKIMKMTLFLHAYPSSPPNRNKFNLPKNSEGCEHISDWFVKIVSVSPDILVNVLHTYIKCIITNADESWKSKDIENVLDYAAKYDAVLFRKCNESIIPFLQNAIASNEVSTRLRTVQLLSRILKTESTVDWSVFCSDVSKVPREVLIIKELISVLLDPSSNVKDKAMHGLIDAFHHGTNIASSILKESIRFAVFKEEGIRLPTEPRIYRNEIRFRKPDPIKPNFSFEGYEMLTDSFALLPTTLYFLFGNASFHTRRNALSLLENIIKINPLIIFNTEFCKKTLCFSMDPAQSIRKHALETVDSILTHYPSCYPVVYVWCKLLVAMLSDNDEGNIAVAAKCFHSKVLSNITGVDQSNRAEHFMPWVIIRELISKNKRLYLQCALDKALDKITISQSVVSLVESHIRTSNSTEAWVILSFITRKVKSRNPDFLMHSFMTLDSWNNEQVLLLSIEVLCNCINDFSRSSLNLAFNKLRDVIKDGTIHYTVVGAAFDLMLHIHHRSDNSVKPCDMEWVAELYDFTVDSVKSQMLDFPNTNTAFMTHLYTYTESYFHFAFTKTNCEIIKFVHKCISKLICIPESRLELENERLLNSMIVIAGRLSLFDETNALITTRLYVKALRNIDRPPIVSTLLTAIRDLCKRYATVLDDLLNVVLTKLNSPYKVNRIETFKCIRTLIVEDQLKLQGEVTIALFEKLLDADEAISNPVCNFLYYFNRNKDVDFFKKQLSECPFMLNEFKYEGGRHALMTSELKSGLKGDKNKKLRYHLYNQFMADLIDVELLNIFGLLNNIKAILNHQTSDIPKELIEVVKDVFYILKRICQITSDKKTKQGHETNDENSEKESSKTGGSGKSNKKNKLPTPEEAMNTVKKTICLIYQIGIIIINNDKSFQKFVDNLALAVCQRFPNNAQSAQPAEFWAKYLSKGQSAIKRKSKANFDESCETDTNCESNDEDSPEAAIPMPIRECSDLPMEYLFRSGDSFG